MHVIAYELPVLVRVELCTVVVVVVGAAVVVVVVVGCNVVVDPEEKNYKGSFSTQFWSSYHDIK